MLKGSVSVVALTGSAQEVIGPSERRRTITFGLSPAAGATVVNNRSPANANDGYAVGSPNSTLIIDEKEFGSLASAPWFAFSAAATGNIVIVEGLEQ